MEDSTAERQPKILVFAASNRIDSLNRKLARAAESALRLEGAATTYIELRDYPLPLYDGDLEEEEGLPLAAVQLRSVIRDHDLLAIASPEFNGSFSPLLKNAIDWASRPEPGERHLEAFRGKLAALMSASPGAGGGRRGLRHLRELFEMIGVRVLPSELVIGRASSAFNSEGGFVRDADQQALNVWAREVVQAGSGSH